MKLRLSLLVVAFASACGSEVRQDAAGAVGSSASSTAASAVASSSAASSSSGAGGASSSSSSGAGGAPLCNEGTLDLDGDGPTQHFAFSCPGWGTSQSSTVLAYRDSHGGFVGDLRVVGCSAPSGQPPYFDLLSVFPKVGNMQNDGIAGDALYVDASGTTFQIPFNGPNVFATKLTHDALKVGEYFDGTFTVVVVQGMQSKMLTGSFHACRVDDAPPKP